eukprot:2834748-Rhodomonas_salina.1
MVEVLFTSNGGTGGGFGASWTSTGVMAMSSSSTAMPTTAEATTTAGMTTTTLVGSGLEPCGGL